MSIAVSIPNLLIVSKRTMSPITSQVQPIPKLQFAPQANLQLTTSGSKGITGIILMGQTLMHNSSSNALRQMD